MFAPVPQLEEDRISNPTVAGSSPAGGASYFGSNYDLILSVCQIGGAAVYADTEFVGLEDGGGEPKPQHGAHADP